jgi:hypothetical protein
MTIIEIPPHAHAVRERYAAGATIDAIRREFGITKREVYYCVDGGPKVGGKRVLRPLPRRYVHGLSLRARRALISRVASTLATKMHEIESRTDRTAEEHDNDIRTLAVITRSISELHAIDGRTRDMRRKDTAPDNDRPIPVPEPVPVDIEELRRSVARKLQNLIAEEEE